MSASTRARILRREIERLGYERTFSIYDDADQQALLRRIVRELSLNDKVYTPRMLAARISDAKNHSLDPARLLREEGAPQQVCDAFARYEKALRHNNALDFDDLLLKVLELFERFPEVLQRYQQRFRYILVDEYQDTNLAQYHIVQRLAAAHRNLCVVGDDDQSIYGWRGALFGQQVGDAVREHARLAAARAGEHQQRPLRGAHGLQLLRVEPRQIQLALNAIHASIIAHPHGRLTRAPARIARAICRGGGRNVSKSETLPVWLVKPRPMGL